MRYKGLQWVRGLQWAGGGLQGVTRGYGMVWYGMVTLFIHGISFRYIYIQE